MALQPGHVKNFETMKRAGAAGNLALMECVDKATGNYVATICMVHMDGDEFVFTPVAKLFDGNPYDELIPASPNLLEKANG